MTLVASRSEADERHAGGSVETAERMLSREVGAALDQCDNIVMVLEERGDVLRIAAANAQSERSTGYLADQLVGQPFGLLTGPETDPAELDAIHAAARQGRAHRTRLRCRTCAGQPFWLGLHLMPAERPGAGGRFVLLGRDITAKLRLKEQNQAVQGLLAKVFVTVDVPVSIIDLQGRMVMTNPAYETLLGARSGGLTGTMSLDLVAPRCREAITAARMRQDVDGLDYDMAVTMLRTDGGEVACRLTCVMVQRADRLRFRMITLRPDAAPAASRVTAGGHIQLVGLEEVRQSLGARWPAARERAMATAERILASRLGPQDTFSRTDDSGFVICFADATEDDATFRAASIGREVRRRLIGDGESAEVAHVLSAATALPPEVADLPGADLARIVNERIRRRLRTLQAAARDRLADALEQASYELDAVHSRERDEPVGAFVRLSRETEGAFESALAVLPGAETAGLNKDAILLGLARECALEGALQNARQLLFVTLSADILLERRRMEACLQACSAIEERLRQHIVLVVTLPAEGGSSRITTELPRLRPFCRAIGIAVETLDAADPGIRALGLGFMVVDAAACAAPGWEPRLRARSTGLRTQRCRLMVRGTLGSNAPRLFAHGADLVSALVDSGAG